MHQSERTFLFAINAVEIKEEKILFESLYSNQFINCVKTLPHERKA